MWLMRYCGIDSSSACVVAMPAGRDGTDGVVEMDGFLGGMCLFCSGADGYGGEIWCDLI